MAAVLLAGGLAAKFNGSNLVTKDIYTQVPFLSAVILAAAGTVLLASRLGLPISTTHALVGSLIGAGVSAAGIANVHFSALGRGVVLPLLFSPVAALLMTLAVYPLVQKLSASRDCVCINETATVASAPARGTTSAIAVAAPPDFRWANSTECETGAEALRFSLSDGLHWLSGAAISFARGLNDTPKIAAVLLVARDSAPTLNYAPVAAMMAIGGIMGAARVAQTMGKKITPMATHEAVTANLGAAALVILASQFGMPVSTTHVTTGGIFGIGLLRRREADWRRVRDISLSDGLSRCQWRRYWPL